MNLASLGISSVCETHLRSVPNACVMIDRKATCTTAYPQISHHSKQQSRALLEAPSVRAAWRHGLYLVHGISRGQEATAESKNAEKTNLEKSHAQMIAAPTP